ncbi:trypsin-like peptidase domain-containing protein [Variovorax sp. PBL-E5]|uniref:trypsin-like peptidase domain-containing protein n=1 Tax=Variovorax sp. PBL-E5 TaxID=434014 RepID=UPI001318B1F2|nr:trypsin-like peptidase domain-containing protein [Variovorax sp. PBL-E5]VTU22184.1 putative periplasmic serine endoprotease DegP-like precursor [Variovorax sp. PBL-E5]
MPDRGSVFGRRLIRCVAFAGLLAACGAGAAQPTATSETTAFAALVAGRSATVVDITALRFDRDADADDEDNVEITPDADFADRLAQPLPAGLAISQIRDVASGVILSSDGLILTSGHVVAGVDEAQVRLSDGRKFAARLIGADRPTDVGLLKIEASGLPAAVFGDSSTLAPGDWVAAIGAPFGFHGSVTAGVVSATDRYLSGAGEIPFVQTDVAINPGSSGSPLFNARGEVVAINSMIYSGSGGYMGLSFAVPINLAMQIAIELRAHGSVRRARLGAEFQEVSPALAQSFGLSAAAGALVVHVQADSPAEAAGLLSGDIVSAIDSIRIERFTELLRDVVHRTPGTRVKLQAWRRGRAVTLWATLNEELHAQTPPVPRPPTPTGDGLGLGLTELSRMQRVQLRIEGGLLVRQAIGPARSEGLRAGDIILAVNDVVVDRVDDYSRIVSRMAPGRMAALLVLRAGRRAYVPIQAPARAARRETRGD